MYGSTQPAVGTGISTTGSTAKMRTSYGRQLDGADISARCGGGRGVADEPRRPVAGDGGHITPAHASAELHRMVELLGWRHPRLTTDPPVENASTGAEVNS